MSETDSLLSTLEELSELADDVMNATYQTFESALQRFMTPLKRDALLGMLSDEILPQVDVDTWYTRATGRMGRDALEFPVDRLERVGLQLALLRKCVNSPRNAVDCCAILVSADGKVSSHLKAFNQQVFRPFFRDFRRSIETHLRPSKSTRTNRASSGATSSTNENLIDPSRIAALRATRTAAFDLRKLIRLCEELNTCYAQSCVFAVAMLTRAVMDHVPPIFGFTKFIEVVNNHNGGKSFGASMKHLQGSARNIADAHLHNPIRNRESLPNLTQVNFANDLDVLLAEIERILA